MDLRGHFEALMNRSPISEREIASFLREMRRTPSGTVITCKLLATKIQSGSEAQGIQAFEVLESCLSSETEGSIEFRTEAGRFRFLNEIIRILSPKYMGEKTNPAVKERAIKFLEGAVGPKRRQWFPSEHSKIRAVYDSLVEGGVIQRALRSSSTEYDEEAELQKSIFDRAENAAVLKKLLQSKDPQDLQAANRLIKNLVAEESKRIERRAELHSLIDRIQTSTSLLTEVLSPACVDQEIVEELVEQCRSLRQKLGGIATETTEETNSLLLASESLEQVLNLYEEKKAMPQLEFESEPEPKNVEDSQAVSTAEKGNLTLADELLLQLDLGTMEDVLNSKTEATKSAFHDSSNLLNLEIDLCSKPLICRNEEKATVKNPLEEIDKLSKQLMEASLPGRNKKIEDPPEAKEIVENAAKSPLMQNHAPTAVTTTDSSLLDLGMFENPTSISNSPPSSSQFEKQTNKENLLFDFNEDSLSTKLPSHSITAATIPQPSLDPEEVRKLLNSFKDLEADKLDLQDCLEPIQLDTGSCDPQRVSLSITFGTMSGVPSRVKVGVISLVNKASNYGLFNYVFQVIPPKGISAKLFSPTPANELPAWKKTFLPPPVLNQVVLLAFPPTTPTPTEKLTMKYILSFSMDDSTVIHNGEFQLPENLC